jgi:hypothetical protein
MPVSRLGDLLRRFVELYSQLGDGTTIQVGRHYLSEFGAGSPPRILFVPSTDGSLGEAPRLNANYITGFSDGCTCYVRAVEGVDDVARLDTVDEMVDRVVNVLKAIAGARVKIVGARPVDDSQLDVPNAAGADKFFTFRFERGIARQPSVWRRDLQTPISPPNPDQPQGDSGEIFTVAISATAVRQ